MLVCWQVSWQIVLITIMVIVNFVINYIYVNKIENLPSILVNISFLIRVFYRKMEPVLSHSMQAKLLISAGIIASMAAIWHLLCILGGPSWFIFARAPHFVIHSAQQGTLIAPIATLVVASLMFACSLFAFSAAGVIGKLPLLKAALITIATLCLLRSFIAIPVLVTAIEMDVWEIIASSVWFYLGLCFLLGALKKEF